MIEVSDLLMAWRWPITIILSSAILGRAIAVVARAGIRVEIFTRRPIQVSSGALPLQAQVTSVRL